MPETELCKGSPFPPPELEDYAQRSLKATSVVWNDLSRGTGTSESGMQLSKGPLREKDHAVAHNTSVLRWGFIAMVKNCPFKAAELKNESPSVIV